MSLLCASFESRPELYRRIFMGFLPNYFNRYLLTNLWNAPQQIGERKQKKNNYSTVQQREKFSLLSCCSVLCRKLADFFLVIINSSHEPQEYSGIFFSHPPPRRMFVLVFALFERQPPANKLQPKSVRTPVLAQKCEETSFFTSAQTDL